MWGRWCKRGSLLVFTSPIPAGVGPRLSPFVFRGRGREEAEDKRAMASLCRVRHASVFSTQRPLRLIRVSTIGPPFAYHIA
ncbi:hypothetical protein LZ30DRAFT_723546 [Colletotrichum cereale]|nr:hypothetical protein LZ30DRAFT_723546 [Colletotrichum cereale]